MKKAIILVTTFGFGLLALVPVAESQAESYPYAYVRFLDGEATLQRASESEPEEAGVNVPVMPGDRLWTHAGSRAEIRFADGTLLRLAEGTRVDFVDFDREQLVRVWSGSVILKITEASNAYRIDSPAGSVYPAAEGRFRIDLDEGRDSMTLSVTEGVAELASSSGSVLVRSGQRSLVEPGSPPETPFGFNTARWDGFDAWSDDRDRYRTSYQPPEELPSEIHTYVDDLGGYGDWREEEDLGYVWYPSVSVGWAPYRSGRWCYTSYGYTWASYEPWGWAPYHYGRWGYNHRGWYWIPGARWSPAWVSWAIGPFWLGWSPLGYHDRPVFGYKSAFHYGGYYGDYYSGKRHGGGRYGGPYYRGGKAVPRQVFENGAGWNFVDRRHVRSRAGNVRLRADDLRETSERARVLDDGAILSRDLEPRVVGAPAMARSRARERFVEAGGPREAINARPMVRTRSSSPDSSRPLGDAGARVRARSGSSVMVPSNRSGATARGALREGNNRDRGNAPGDGNTRSLGRPGLTTPSPILRSRPSSRDSGNVIRQTPARPSRPSSTITERSTTRPSPQGRVSERTGRRSVPSTGTPRSTVTPRTPARSRGAERPATRSRTNENVQRGTSRSRVPTSTSRGESRGSPRVMTPSPPSRSRGSVRTPSTNRGVERSRSRGESFFNRSSSSRSSSRGRVTRPSSRSSSGSRPSVGTRSSGSRRPSVGGGGNRPSRSSSRPKASGSRGSTKKSSSRSSRSSAKRRN